MRFKKYGKLIPNALEEQMKELQPVNSVVNFLFKRFDYLLNLLKKEKSLNYKNYLSNLDKKYQELVKENYVEKNNLRIKEIIDNFDSLKKNPIIATHILNYVIQLLQLSYEDNWIEEKVKVTQRNYLLAFIAPEYYNLEILAKTLRRDEAFQFYKIYITQQIIDNASPERKIFETVDEFKEHFEKDKKEATIGWIGVLSEVENGKFYFRKDNCLWAEAIEILPDKDIKYLVCCYGDFQAAASRSKGNFVLTMVHTIAEGAPYCDCIYHDTNVDWDLTHPPAEYWDSIKGETNENNHT